MKVKPRVDRIHSPASTSQPRARGRMSMRGGDAQGHRNTDTDIPIRDGKRVRLVCVGDVHGCWSEESTKALESLEPDVALFVGDMGNEDVELVESIAQIQVCVSKVVDVDVCA